MATVDMVASKLLKSIIKLGVFFVQVFGIWPYRYDRNSKSFHTTKLLRCYRTVVVPFILFAYVFSIKTIQINTDVRVHISSSIGRFTTVFLSLSVVVVYVITSVSQFMNYNSINEWLKKARMIMEQIHCFGKGYELPFLWPVMHFTVNVLVINVLIIYATIGIMSHLITATAWKNWLIAFLILPIASVTIISNIFYGFMLTINYYYRFLNNLLRNIVQELNNNNNNDFQKQLFHLSDAIDRLAILHREVTTCTMLINRIFSVQLLFFMTYEICVFISKLFIIYIIFQFELRKLRTGTTSQFNYAILWYNELVFVVAFWTTFVLSHTCHTTMKEVNFKFEKFHKYFLNDTHSFGYSLIKPETFYFPFCCINQLMSG